MQVLNLVIFRVGEVSWNKDTSINIWSKAQEKKSRREAFRSFLLLMLLKLHFGKFTPKMGHNQGHFFQNQSIFYYIRILVCSVCISRCSTIYHIIFLRINELRIRMTKLRIKLRITKLLINFSFWLQWRQSFRSIKMNSWVMFQMWNNKKEVS